MPKNPKFSHDQLVTLATRYFTEKGEWPTVHSFRSGGLVGMPTPIASTQRAGEALNEAKRRQAGDVPRYRYEALAYLAGFRSPQDADMVLDQLKNGHEPAQRLPNRTKAAVRRAAVAMQNEGLSPTDLDRRNLAAAQFLNQVNADQLRRRVQALHQSRPSRKSN